MDPRLYKYLEYIVTTAHGTEMPAVLQDKIINDLTIQLEGTMATTLLDRLSPAQQTEYNSLLAQQPTNEQVMAWFEQRIPDAAEIIRQVMTKFEQDYLNLMKA